jgi:hypothetical protein
VKESDRISAGGELGRREIEERPDGFIIIGPAQHMALCDSRRSPPGDVAGVAGLIAEAKQRRAPKPISHS